MIEWIGYIAGVMSTSAMLPQVIRAHKTKSTGDISSHTIIIMFASMVLWVIYGAFVNSQSLFWSCFVAMIFWGWIGVIKFTHK